MPIYYPPVGFHFRVDFLGVPANDNDCRFSEVGGLAMEMTAEETPEGGQNRFVQKYPTRAKYPDLVLKRGMLRGSEVLKWVRQCIEDYVIQPMNVDVVLLNENHEPLVTWHVINAYPTRWSITDLNASGNALVIESLQLCYQYFTADEG
jgi:phage tail-like protein